MFLFLCVCLISLSMVNHFINCYSKIGKILLMYTNNFINLFFLHLIWWNGAEERLLIVKATYRKPEFGSHYVWQTIHNHQQLQLQGIQHCLLTFLAPSISQHIPKRKERVSYPPFHYMSSPSLRHMLQSCRYRFITSPVYCFFCLWLWLCFLWVMFMYVCVQCMASLSGPCHRRYGGHRTSFVCFPSCLGLGLLWLTTEYTM